MSSSTKICTKCGEEKPIEAFSKRTAAKDGLKPACKECCAAVGKAYAGRPEVVAARRARERTPKAKNRKRARESSAEAKAARREKDSLPEKKAKKRTYSQAYSSRPEAKSVAREGRLLRCYGISRQEYSAILLRQGGGCAICGTVPEEEFDKCLRVDHCHGTNVVRGLLCSKCNVGVGQFKDDAGLLTAAAAYLSSPTVRLPTPACAEPTQAALFQEMLSLTQPVDQRASR